MRIIIDIPKEFEEHFKQDNFEDTLHRLCADAHLIAGNYEKETAVMLIQTFKESIPVDRIVEQLEYAKEMPLTDCGISYNRAIDLAINLVKEGGTDG